MRSVSYIVGDIEVSTYKEALSFKKPFITKLTHIDESRPVNKERIAKIRKHFAKSKKR